MKKVIISSFVFLASLGGYVFGRVIDNAFLIDYMPEIGGASIVILLYFLLEKLF